MQGQSKYKAMKGITAIFKHFSLVQSVLHLPNTDKHSENTHE